MTPLYFCPTNIRELGHNYYNSRDMEKLTRRMGWMEKLMKQSEHKDWKNTYSVKVARRERGQDIKTSSRHPHESAVVET